MRLSLCSLLFALTAVCNAQDTNFPTGPQYLITNNSSPLFLQSIATPTLSLSEAAPVTNNTVEAGPFPETATLPPVSLAKIFWGERSFAEADAPRIVTPSLSLPEPTPSATGSAAENESEPVPASLEAASPAQTSVVEINSTQFPANVPASIFNPGVTGTADTQSLLNRGYGLSLGELATYWKSHKRPASHVITNEELERKPRN